MEPGSWSRTLVSRTKFFFKTETWVDPRYRTLRRLRREAAVDLDAISSVFLRLVQRLVRVLEEGLHRIPMLGPRRQAQARGHPHSAELALDQLPLDPLADPFRHG